MSILKLISPTSAEVLYCPPVSISKYIHSLPSSYNLLSYDAEVWASDVCLSVFDQYEPYAKSFSYSVPLRWRDSNLL